MNTTQPTTETRSHTVTALLAGVRDDLRARRAARAEHQRLVRELATYTHASEIDDLYAALDRYDDSEVAQIRTILARQRVA